MLRMFKRQPYSFLPLERVEKYRASPQERQVLDSYAERFVNGTAAEVSAVLEDLHASAGVDEVMLVAMGYSRAAQARAVQLIADHYGMPKSHGHCEPVNTRTKAVWILFWPTVKSPIGGNRPSLCWSGSVVNSRWLAGPPEAKVRRARASAAPTRQRPARMHSRREVVAPPVPRVPSPDD